MKVGIGVPGSPGMPGDMVLNWARKSDAGPFSSLAAIDRLVAPILRSPARGIFETILPGRAH